MLNKKCPECGSLADTLLVQKARNLFAMNKDGTIGKMLTASNFVADESFFKCVNEHEWLAEYIED